MTSAHGDAALHPTRHRISLAIAVLATVPGIVIRLTELHLSHPAEALLFGLSIVGAAFMLSWAAEVAQIDISAGLAIALLAFIAVLPEYAVDMVFAWKAGHAVAAFGPECRPPGELLESPCSLALANMTGANRLLIGIGWSMVVFIAWYRTSKKGDTFTGVALERSNSIELAFLAVATAYSLTLPLKTTITLLDALVLVGIFIAYTIRISTAPAEEPHLVGPASYLGTFADSPRRTAVGIMFLFAAGVILLVAEHFAEALVATGRDYNISEFLLVQWLAPLASEAPELLVAGLYAWRLNTVAGLGTLVSSKVNQWTLLVGTLPIVFAIASGTLGGLPVEPRQREELLLTAAQSVFAVAILVSLSISKWEALTLFGLFWAQFILGGMVPEEWHGAERIGVSIVYLLLAGWIGVREMASVKTLIRDGFRTSHQALRE
ncbi:MAG TPA: sodium:proton exchanger [Candidatus Binatia bacterium]|jgi:cation:H+ antiporter|nr:sodium:proton exchanger [Candidatus Binatia bacterium]